MLLRQADKQPEIQNVNNQGLKLSEEEEQESSMAISCACRQRLTVSSPYQHK